MAINSKHLHLSLNNTIFASIIHKSTNIKPHEESFLRNLSIYPMHCYN